jgi:hypothetical protein
VDLFDYMLGFLEVSVDEGEELPYMVVQPFGSCFGDAVDAADDGAPFQRVFVELWDAVEVVDACLLLGGAEQLVMD